MRQLKAVWLIRRPCTVFLRRGEIISASVRLVQYDYPLCQVCSTHPTHAVYLDWMCAWLLDFDKRFTEVSTDGRASLPCHSAVDNDADLDSGHPSKNGSSN